MKWDSAGMEPKIIAGLDRQAALAGAGRSMGEGDHFGKRQTMENKKFIGVDIGASKNSYEPGGGWQGAGAGQSRRCPGTR